VRALLAAAARDITKEAFRNLLPVAASTGLCLSTANYWWCATGGCKRQRAAGNAFNRKVVSAKLTKDYSDPCCAAYDSAGDADNDLREL